VIELIDLNRGGVVAAGRFDNVVGAACDSRMAYQVVESEDGDTRLVLMEPFVAGL
jgi:hypothetical protein